MRSLNTLVVPVVLIAVAASAYRASGPSVPAAGAAPHRAPALAVTADARVGARRPPASSAWLGRLPDGEMKRRFILGCTGCHVLDQQVAFPEGRPRSVASWVERIGSMHARFGPGTGFPIIADPIPADSLASWLALHLGDALPEPEELTADPRVTEFLVPAPQDLPHDLALLPGGRVAVTGMFTERMYILDPAQGTWSTDTIPVRLANPRAVHADPDGTLWVVLGAARQLARRDTSGSWRATPVGMYAHSVARDATGAWVNGHFTGHPTVLAHVRDDGTITRHELPSATPAGTSPIPYELRVAPDGRVWMSELQGNRVLALDPRTGRHQAFTMPVAHGGPRRLDISADGRVWIPLYAGGTLVELDPRSGAMRQHTLPDADALPYVVRVDDTRGVAWVGTGASDAVYRLTMTTGRVERIALPSRGALVRHLDVDRTSGDLWVAYGASPGREPARIARVRLGATSSTMRE